MEFFVFYLFLNKRNVNDGWQRSSLEEKRDETNKLEREKVKFKSIDDCEPGNIFNVWTKNYPNLDPSCIHSSWQMVSKERTSLIITWHVRACDPDSSTQTTSLLQICRWDTRSDTCTYHACYVGPPWLLLLTWFTCMAGCASHMPCSNMNLTYVRWCSHHGYAYISSTICLSCWCGSPSQCHVSNPFGLWTSPWHSWWAPSRELISPLVRGDFGAVSYH